MPEPFELKSVPLPPDSEVTAFAAACPEIRPLRYDDGEVLIRRGDSSMNVYLLLRGSCRVESVDAPPEEADDEAVEPSMQSAFAVVDGTPENPVFLGEMAYLAEGRRTATVRSVGSSWALEMPPSCLDVAMGRFPFLTTVLCRQFARRLREADTMLAAYQRRLALAGHHVYVKAGDTIFSEGEPADQLYYLVEGALVCGDGEEIHPSAENQVLLDVGAYLRGTVHSYTARAKTDSLLLAVGEESQAAVIARHPHVALALIRGEQV